MNGIHLQSKFFEFALRAMWMSEVIEHNEGQHDDDGSLGCRRGGGVWQNLLRHAYAAGGCGLRGSKKGPQWAGQQAASAHRAMSRYRRCRRCDKARATT